MNIILVCSAGMSTSLLVTNMEKTAVYGEKIKAIPYLDLENVIDDYDVVLIGPQLGYKTAEITRLCDEKGKVCGRLDMVAFGRMDGKAAYEQAVKLFTNRHKC